VSTASSVNRAQPLDPTVIAVAHRAGGRVRVLAARLDGLRMRHVGSTDLPEEATDRLQAWLDEVGAGSVIGVVPASHVICRTVALPDVPENQLDQALHLHAESHLLGIAPDHRVAMTVLPAAREESGRSGLIVAWPESSKFHLPIEGRMIQFAPDVVGVAALAGAHRPNEPVVWTDPTLGSIAVALAHSGGLVLRGTREATGDGSDWRDQVRRVVVETGLGVNHTPEYIRDVAAALDDRLAEQLETREEPTSFVLPEILRQQAAEQLTDVPSAEDDPHWWERFGVAVGVLIARNSDLSPLTVLLDEEPDDGPSRLARLVDELSRPRTAIGALCLVLVLLGFSPLIQHGLRLKTLQVRHPNLDAEIDEIKQIRNQIVLYRELEDQAWPMAKLLGDVFNAMPLGIQLETVRLNRGDTVVLGGTVSPTDDGAVTPQQVLGRMQRNLLETRVFSDPAFDIGDMDKFTKQYSFDFSAKITAPHRDPGYEPDVDFAVYTHEMRINGDPPPSEATDESDDEVLVASGPSAGDDAPAIPGGPRSGDTTPGGREAAAPSEDDGDGPSGELGDETADEGEAEGSSPGRRNPGRGPIGGNRIGDGATGLDEGRAEGAGSSVQAEIPEPMTPAQIKAMNFQQTNEFLTKVAAARKFYRQQGDDEQEKLFKEQFDLTFQHLKDLRSQGAGR